MTVIDFGMTTYKDSKYYILSDEMDNLYRLFVKSETEYMRYKLGHIIDDEAVTDFGTAIDGKKIKVYKKDQTAIYILKTEQPSLTLHLPSTLRLASTLIILLSMEA